jgi:hypothetical protein
LIWPTGPNILTFKGIFECFKNKFRTFAHIPFIVHVHPKITTFSKVRSKKKTLHSEEEKTHFLSRPQIDSVATTTTTTNIINPFMIFEAVNTEEKIFVSMTVLWCVHHSN